MLKNYTKMALKVLLRRKLFTCISLFTISFTLMVLMVAASLFDHVFGSFPPETRSDRTLLVSSMRGEHDESPGYSLQGPSYAFLERYVSPLANAEKVSIYRSITTVTTFREGGKVESQLKCTDGAFWEILEFDFLEGRPYSAQEVEEGRRVAVINEATRRVFFGEEQAVGQHIELKGLPFRVVGVVPDVPFYRMVPFADVWVPHSAFGTDAYRRYDSLFGPFQALILAPGAAAIPLIHEEFADVLTRIEYPNPDRINRLVASPTTLLDMVANLVFALGALTGRGLMVLVVVLALLFMLLPVISLVNINTTRILERASEIGVRKAFGGSSLTLVGQFLAENVILTLLGGAVGLALTWLVLQMLGAAAVVQYADFQLNHRIFLYGLVMTLFFGLVSGVWPAWKMSRLHVVEAFQRRKR
ncbi:MAG: ABC transporter permease [Gemmatimonadaceae bacterium]|nr:ABC transporter permease [Gemmatimonadaceae bacterium]